MCEQRIRCLCEAFGVLPLDIFLSDTRYRHPISVVMFTCTHPRCSHSCSTSINLQSHMARHHVRLEGSSACESTVVHEVQVKTVGQKQSIKSASSGTK